MPLPNPLAPQGAVVTLGVPNSQDYPRLVFGAPYHTLVPIAELLAPAVNESVQAQLPALVPPYVDQAAQNAVQQSAVLKTGSTMSGPLMLSPLMPTADSMAASKSYVDTMISTAGVPEVPAVPNGQTWGRQTGQWVALTTQTGVFLPVSGGTMQGQIDMGGNAITNLPVVPVMPNGAAPAQWVLNQIASVSLYQGTWNLDTMTPDLTNPNTHVNGYTWIAITAGAGVVIGPAIPGLQGTTVYNGDHVVFAAAQGTFSALHSVGLTLSQGDARYLQLAGGQMSGALLLNTNATAPTQAVTLQQMNAAVTGAGIGEAPNDGQIYGRNGVTHGWNPTLPLVGGIMSGPLSLSANAATALQAVPFQQLNSAIATAVSGYVAVTGSTMTGLLVLSGNAGASLNPVPLQQLNTMLAGYASIDAPVFTGDARAVTPAPGDADTSIATTAFVAAAVTALAPINAPVFTGDARAVTPAAGDADTSIATTAFVAAAVTPAQNNVGRSFIHNGLFNIAQRGAGPFTGNFNFTVDRWQILATLDTVSVGPGLLGDPDRAGIGDEAAVNQLVNTFTGNAGASAFNTLTQHIEKVRRLAGKTITVSFWSKAGSALKIGVSVSQNFGSGGAPSAGVDGVGTAIQLSTSWARYSATFTVPSASGKTLGSNGDDYTALFFWFSAGANYATQAGSVGVQSGTIQLWGVQLEIGTRATPLEKPDPQQDLAKCQRFYQTGLINLLGWGGAVGTVLGQQQSYPVPMRAVPTLTPNFTQQTMCTGGVMANGGTDGFEPYLTATVIGQTILHGSFTAAADV